MSTTTPQLNAAQMAYAQNQAAKNAILANAVSKKDLLFSSTYNPANTPIPSFVLKQTGLLQGVLLKVVATVANTDGALAGNITGVGAPNIITNITLTDPSNSQRINTTGMHLYTVDSAKQRTIYGSAFTNDNPGSFGGNFKPISAPATIAHGATGTVVCYYWIPAQYSEDDFRGAIYMGVSSANVTVSFSFNPFVGVAAGADPTNAVYIGTANMSITSAVVTAYQHYWDQIPQNQNGQLMLPVQDMGWMYELKFTPFGLMTAGFDNPLPLTNARNFLSTMLYYNSYPAPAIGTDINYIKLTAANTYDHWKADPLTVALRSRFVLGDDLPPGFYWLESRKRPLATAQYGNLAYYLNPSTANANNYAVCYYEDFAIATLIGGAQSLPS